jgi:hypothetical protein
VLFFECEWQEEREILLLLSLLLLLASAPLLRYEAAARILLVVSLQRFHVSLRYRVQLWCLHAVCSWRVVSSCLLLAC